MLNIEILKAESFVQHLSNLPELRNTNTLVSLLRYLTLKITDKRSSTTSIAIFPFQRPDIMQTMIDNDIIDKGTKEIKRAAHPAAAEPAI